MLNKFKCWFLGHDPDLREDMKVVIPATRHETPLAIITVYGRVLYVGDTHCKRCGKKQSLTGDITQRR